MNTCDQKDHSFIHNISIASPCTADWNLMAGDDVSRYCGQCKLNVYNIAGLTVEDAEKLIIEKEGKLCLRIFRRKDGTVLTKDCPVGVAARIRSFTIRTAASVAACISVLAGYLLVQKNAAQNCSIQQQYRNHYERANNALRTHSLGPGVAGGVSFVEMKGDAKALPTPPPPEAGSRDYEAELRLTRESIDHPQFGIDN